MALLWLKKTHNPQHYIVLHDTSNTVRVEGPLSAMAHEAGCGPVKSADRVCVCVTYNKVGNISYL
jgi:hypothetical protein